MQQDEHSNSQAEEVPEGMEEVEPQHDVPPKQKRREEVISEILMMLGEDAELDIDYEKDPRIVKIMAMSNDKLQATLLYLQRQNSSRLNASLVQKTIEQLGNLVFRIAQEEGNKDAVLKDRELKLALKQELGWFLDYFPNKLKALLIAGSHLMSAFSTARSRGTSAPPAETPL